MSVISRGLRASSRSKSIASRLRGQAGEVSGRAAMAATAVTLVPPPAPVRAAGAWLPPELQATAEHLAELFATAEFETWAVGGPLPAGRDGVPLDPAPEALLARAVYRQAMRAVPLALSPLVVHVCCLGLPIGQWADQKQVPRPAAERGLRQALTHLLNHFRAAT